MPPAFAENIAAFGNSGAIFNAHLVEDTPPVEEMSVPLNEIYVSQMLKEQGYRTLMLGKWHLGATDTSRPESRGFDEALGFMPGAALFLPKNHPDVVNSMQDFDPIDRFLWANLPFAIQYNGSRHFAPSEYMTDYSRTRREGDPRKPQPPVLHVSRLQRAAHAATGAQIRL